MLDPQAGLIPNRIKQILQIILLHILFISIFTSWKFYIINSKLFANVPQGSMLDRVDPILFSIYTFLLWVLFTILHNHLLSLISSMLTTSFFTSPFPPRNHILAYSASTNVYSLYWVYSWFSINSLSSLTQRFQIKFHTFLYSPSRQRLYVTFLLIHMLILPAAIFQQQWLRTVIAPKKISNLNSE